jgi:hypothetical protein
MPHQKAAYAVPIWRKPQCFGDFDETCSTNLREGCQWIEACKSYSKCLNKNNKKGICQPISCPRNYRCFGDFKEHCIDNSLNVKSEEKQE